VRAVLNVIADFTDLNIITSDTVTGNLTLRLKDVPWDQALDIILKANKLGYTVDGTVVRIAPLAVLAAVALSGLLGSGAVTLHHLLDRLGAPIVAPAT
jgi:type IV pilus assembly protein PilQ